MDHRAPELRRRSLREAHNDPEGHGGRGRAEQKAEDSNKHVITLPVSGNRAPCASADRQGHCSVIGLAAVIGEILPPAPSRPRMPPAPPPPRPAAASPSAGWRRAGARTPPPR